jgi:hypothetical protein
MGAGGRCVGRRHRARFRGLVREAIAGSIAAGNRRANYMMLTGYVCGGWQMARAALAACARLAEGADEDFYRAKIATARFYAEQMLPNASSLLAAVKSGGSAALMRPEDQF